MALKSVQALIIFEDNPSSPGVPTHPIAPGGTPGVPTHPIAPGGEHPEHPIVLPPPDANIPGIWPSPGHPAHPIVLPPEPPPQVWPDPPGKPPGGQTGSPSNPINLPPNTIQSTHGFWALCYFAEMGGWLWAWVPVQVEKSGRR